MNDEQAQVLNFAARLVTRNRDDQLRKFVVSYFLYDHTLQIYEELVQNSGFRHGKFVQKTRLINPATQQFFEPHDFHVGAKVTISGRVFELLASSPLATGIMEANPDEFPESDLGRVIGILKTAVTSNGQDLRKLLQDAAARSPDGELTPCCARAVFEKLAPAVTKQAAETIARGFDRHGVFAAEELLRYLKL
jgi:hypothetical protein